jgi:glycerol-3-phosphate dehydrogenase subunit B
MERLQASPSEMRSAQIARTMDRIWERVVQEVRAQLTDEDAVILPQVFGLKDAAVPGRIRQGIPARVLFVGTLPPSVPGIRTQALLKRRYELLVGTYLAGDEVLGACLSDGAVKSVSTRNLDAHALEADHFILASGGLFSKGLRSNPFRVYEPVFGLDVAFDPDRNAWYDPSFAAEQPYRQFGVRTDAALRPLLGGVPVRNLYAAGSVLGGTRPEFGTGAGQAVRTAFASVDAILNENGL